MAKITVVSTQGNVPGRLTTGAGSSWSGGQLITPGWVTLIGVGSDLRLHERMGRQPTRVIEGYGEWEIIARPRRRGITVWSGRSPLRIQSSIMFDAFKARESVEARIREFEQMAGLDIDKNGVEVEPPLLLRFDNGPHDNSKASQNRWVIEKDIAWDLEEWDGAGQRIRAEATFVYLEYVTDEVYHQSGTQKNSAKKKATTKKTTASKNNGKTTHTVTSGETLVTIAATLYQNREVWKEIASINGLRDPNNISPGDTLELPS